MHEPNTVNDVQHTVASLKTVALLAGLSDAVLADIARHVSIVDLATGDRLFRKGDAAAAMYIVVNGTLEVHDEKTVFNTLGDGDTLGEFALLDGSPRTASVTARGPSTLLRLDADAFLSLLKSNFEITRGVIRALIHRITMEKDHSERLLQSILPREVAQEYRVHRSVAPRHYDRVSVLITDFENFTLVSQKIPPEAVVDELNFCFSKFDEITDKYHITKIKTTGDGYMCAGGIPQPNRTNPVDTVLAGLEIQRFMNARYAEKQAKGQAYWRCRLAINTGDAVSAVIGKTKFTYDLWSDAVNIASRLESHGAAGEVNIGENTFELVKEFFECRSEGRLSFKGERTIAMYAIEGIKPELSRAGEGIEPNEAFGALMRKRFGS